MNEPFGKQKWTGWQRVERVSAVKSSQTNESKQLDLRLDESSSSRVQMKVHLCQKWKIIFLRELEVVCAERRLKASDTVTETSGRVEEDELGAAACGKGCSRIEPNPTCVLGMLHCNLDFSRHLVVHSSNQLLFKNKQTNQPCSRVPHEAGFPFPYYEYKHCFLLGVGLKDECTKRILSWLCWLGK